MASSRTNPHPALTLVKLVGALVVAGVLGAGVLLPYVGGAGLESKSLADKFLNTKCNLVESPPPEKTELFASDGKTLIATIFRQDRQPIPLSQIPKSLQTALIDTEDRRFYDHHGVDIRGLIRSAISTSGGDTQGGSTLTMQYVKQIRYYQAGNNKKKQAAAIAQTIQRKMEDAKCALYIENVKHESKATILDNYLNIAFFGENAYGIETAAQTYFGKPASKLTLPESAMLVGLLRAPTGYDPFINPVAARDRRNQVLQNLVTNGALRQAQANRLKATPISLATTAPPLVKEGCGNAAGTIQNVGFFCDYAVNWLIEHKVLTEAQLQTGGYKIVTTLDANLQNTMQQQLWKKLSTNDDMSAVMPAVDPHTGNILAMATSKQYGNGKHGTTTLPIFTSYTAQAGSTYKLFPLLAALSTGVSPSWRLKTPDPFTKYPWHHCPVGSNGNVQNGDANETFGHNESMRSALAKSSNTYFTGVADQLFMCILNPITNMADSLGMQSLTQPSGDPGPDGRLTVQGTILKYSSAKRLVLGDVATSPLELASAYAAVANDGVYNAPAPIKSVTDHNGNSVTVPRSSPRQVVAPQVARQAVDMLTGDTLDQNGVRGTSADQFTSWYQKHPSLIAGKTGTAPGLNPKTGKSNKNGALWFVGMTPNLVATTAMINLDRPSLEASGLPGVKDDPNQAYGEYSAGVWLKALTPYLRSQKAWTWPTPDSVQGDPVPTLDGLTPDEAKAQLKSHHFKMRQLGAADLLECDSGEPSGTVGYYAPKIALPGSTITVCLSSGVKQDIWTPPPPPPPPPVTHSGGSGAPGSGGGSGGSGGPTGGGGSSGGPGGGGGSGGGGGGGSGGGGGHGGGGGGHGHGH